MSTGGSILVSAIDLLGITGPITPAAVNAAYGTLSAIAVEDTVTPSAGSRRLRG